MRFLGRVSPEWTLRFLSVILCVTTPHGTGRASAAAQTPAFSGHLRDLAAATGEQYDENPLPSPQFDKNTPLAVAPVTVNREESWIISAQCQARCLENYHIYRATGTSASDGATLSQLENSESSSDVAAATTTLKTAPEFGTCSRDSSCSSCLQPCWKETFEYERCIQVCEDSKSHESCVSSCKFLSDKATSPNRPSLRSTQQRDTEQRGEAASSVTATTSWLEFMHFTVNEVWDTRGAILEWKIKEHRGAVAPSAAPQTHHHHHRHHHLPLMYVVQMRQLIHLDPVTGTEWTAITTTPSTCYDLKNALSLGLHYQARIIAISSHGVRNTSMESSPFGLPKEHPEPGPPQNLRHKGYDRREGGILTNTIVWDPPNFSQRISHYLVTWTKQQDQNFSREAGSTANSEMTISPSTWAETEQNDRKRANPALHQQQHLRIPGNKHSYKILNLMPNTTYLIQIQAVAFLGERQIFGDPATLTIHTFSLPLVTPVTSSSTSKPMREIYDQLLPAYVSNPKVHTPFFENGSLVSRLSWHYKEELRGKIAHFIIRLRPQHCADVFDQQSLAMNECRLIANPKDSWIQLPKLRFDCIYHIGIRAVSESGFHGHETIVNFETPSCHNTTARHGTRPNCPRYAPYNFRCEVNLSSKKGATANCRWFYRHDNASTLDSFLVIAGSHAAHHRYGLKNDTVHHFLVDKNIHHVTLTELIPNSKYHVLVRATGINGLGPSAHAYFFVPSLPFYQGTSHQAAYQSGYRNAAEYRRAPLSFFVLMLLLICYYKFCNI